MKKKIVRCRPSSKFAIVAFKPQESLYKKDIYAWSKQQKELLSKRDFEHLDLENVIEEIESVGISQRSALLSHLRNLLMHMLKCKYQPSKHSKSWDKSIKNSKLEIEFVLDENPSLKREVLDAIEVAYEGACKKAHLETGLPLKTFPKKCLWSAEDILI